MPTALIIDDSVFSRSSLKNVLGKGDWKVAEAGNLPKGLELLGEKGFDVIALSAGLPDHSPLEACREVFKAAPGAHVILISKVIDHKMIKQCIVEGAMDYVFKPFNDETLTIFERVANS